MLGWEHTREAIERVLPKVAAVTEPLGGVMVGRSAIALQLEHRASFDVDVLMLNDFDSQQVAGRLAAAADSYTEGQVTAGVFVGMVDGVKVEVWKTSEWQVPVASGPVVLGMPLASLSDMFALKLRNVTSRPFIRDYYDIAVLMDRVMPLEDGIRAYAHRFGRFLIYDDLSDLVSALAMPLDHLIPDPLYADDADAVIQSVHLATARAIRWLTDGNGTEQTGTPPRSPRLPR